MIVNRKTIEKLKERDEETFEPHEYYCKLPMEINKRKIFVFFQKTDNFSKNSPLVSILYLPQPTSPRHYRLGLAKKRPLRERFRDRNRPAR